MCGSAFKFHREIAEMKVETSTGASDSGTPASRPEPRRFHKMAETRRRIHILARHFTSSDKSADASQDVSQTNAIRQSTQEVVERQAGRWYGIDPQKVDIDLPYY